MNTESDFEIARETSRLLSELDQAIDHSSAIRAIVNRREQLYELERLTGPSAKSRSLRREIWRMEQKLRSERAALNSASGSSLLIA